MDYRATSVRMAWEQLPEPVRLLVQEAAGGSVARAHPPVGSGFTGGFAAVLDLDDGRRVFAKAGSSSNPHLVRAYRQEARVLARLPSGVPAPRFVGAGHLAAGVADHEEWQVVVAEAASRVLPLPWTERSLAAVHEACLACADALTPAPEQLGRLPSMVQAYADDTAMLAAFPSSRRGAVRSPRASRRGWRDAIAS